MPLIKYFYKKICIQVNISILIKKSLYLNKNITNEI